MCGAEKEEVGRNNLISSWGGKNPIGVISLGGYVVVPEQRRAPNQIDHPIPTAIREESKA